MFRDAQFRLSAVAFTRDQVQMPFSVYRAFHFRHQQQCKPAVTGLLSRYNLHIHELELRTRDSPLV